jgi:hypothetical protein
MRAGGQTCIRWFQGPQPTRPRHLMGPNRGAQERERAAIKAERKAVAHAHKIVAIWIARQAGGRDSLMEDAINEIARFRQYGRINRSYRREPQVTQVEPTTETDMHLKSTLISAAEGERLHQLCDRGDHRACVRFGMLLNENRAHHDEWRLSHPEFWSFEGDRSVRARGTQDRGDRGETNLPWCGVPYGSTRECVYQTIAQCETDMRPLGGDCEPRD